MRFAHTNIVSPHWKVLDDFFVRTFNCKVVPSIRSQSVEWVKKGTSAKNEKLVGAHLHHSGHAENGPTLRKYQYQFIDRQNERFTNTMSNNHIALEVDSVRFILVLLIKNAGEAIGEITQKAVEGVGELTFIYARYQEGNLIELQSWK